MFDPTAPFEEMVIAPDGKTFAVTVHNVKGKECTKLQEKFQETGKLTKSQLTAEYHAAPAGQVVQQKVNVRR